MKTCLMRLCDGLHALGPPGAEPAGPRPLLIAHRGAVTGTALMENSAAAFDLALKRGFDGLECDIRFTRDGVPVVHHDPDLGRVYGRPDLVIAERDLAALVAAAETLLTFEAFLASYAGRAHLMLELKVACTAEQARQLASLLSPWTPEEHYHLLSLNPGFFTCLADWDRRMMILVSEWAPWKACREVLEAGWGGLAGHYVLTHRCLIRRLKRAGCRVGLGYIHSRRNFFRQWRRGADWLFCDDGRWLDR